MFTISLYPVAILTAFLLIIGISYTVNDSFSTTMNNATMNNATMNNSSQFLVQGFIHKDFTGNSTFINQNTPLLNGTFNDSISSLIISIGNNNTGSMIEVCEHKSYAGNCMILEPGRHNVQTLGWLNDQISSIRMLSPLTIELKNIEPGVLMNGSN